MKEIKTIVISQLLIICFLIGVVLGSLIQEVKIVKVYPKFAGKDFVIAEAKSFHGTLGAYEENNVIRFIDKKGRPCKLFTETKQK